MTHRAIVAAILLLAFVFRALVIANTTEVGVFADMQDYNDRARHLLQHGVLWGDAFRVPFFPIFIAGVYALFGQHLLAVRLAQAAVGVLTVALTYVLARRLTTPRGALIAAAIVAVYPALLLYSVYVMAETLFSFLVMLAAALWTNKRVWTALPAGLAVGAATLTRSLGLALLAGIAVSEAWTVLTRRQALDRWMLARVTLMLAGVALALTPWVQRNYALYGRFVPTDSSSGFNALLGNYPGATGRHPGIPAVEAAAQTYWGTARNDVERSDIGLQVARAFVKEHPAQAARLSVAKAGYLLGLEGREHAWGYSHHYQGRRAPPTVWAWGIAIIISFPLVMIAASVGLWRPGLTRESARRAHPLHARVRGRPPRRELRRQPLSPAVDSVSGHARGPRVFRRRGRAVDVATPRDARPVARVPRAGVEKPGAGTARCPATPRGIPSPAPAALLNRDAIDGNGPHLMTQAASDRSGWTRVTRVHPMHAATHECDLVVATAKCGG